MNRKWLAVGIILLFVGVTFAPSISANISKPESELHFDATFKESFSRLIQAMPPKTKFEKFKNDKTYLLSLQKQLMTIIKNDVTLNSILMKNQNNECVCTDDSTLLEWDFPVTCLLLLPIFIPIFYVFFLSKFTYGSLLFHWINLIGVTLHCPWFLGLVYNHPPLVCASLNYLMLGVFALWILTIGNLNLILDLIFPTFNINIYLGLNLIYLILGVGLELNCPGFK